jgi:hypothetical protein
MLKYSETFSGLQIKCFFNCIYSHKIGVFMVILAGEIGGETKLALFSHKFDGKKIIIDRLISQSEPFSTKKYEVQGEDGIKTLNIKAMLDDFFNDCYYRQEDNYGEGIEKNILGACFGIAALVEGDKDNKKTT